MYCVGFDKDCQRKQSQMTANIDVRVTQTHEESTKCLSTYSKSLKSNERKATLTAELRNETMVLETSSEYGACSSALTTESNESGIQEDTGDYMDDFIKELDNPDCSLCHHTCNEDSPTSNNSIDVRTLSERMKCTINEEREQTQAFLESVKSWKQSDVVTMVKTLAKEELEERVRQEWFQKTFCRKSGQVKNSLTVSERLKMRKERVRQNKN